MSIGGLLPFPDIKRAAITCFSHLVIDLSCCLLLLQELGLHPLASLLKRPHSLCSYPICCSCPVPAIKPLRMLLLLLLLCVHAFAYAFACRTVCIFKPGWSEVPSLSQGPGHLSLEQSQNL